MATPPDMVASLQYQKEHIQDDRTSLLLGVVWSLWALAATSVCLRLYAQSMVRSSWRWRLHDTLIVIGLTFTGGKCLVSTIGTFYGTGRHLILSSQTDLVVLAKLSFAFNYVYAAANASTKASILVFFYYTFPNRGFQRLIRYTGGFVLLWFLANIIASTFQCIPIDLAWDKTKMGQCINMKSLLVSLGIINAMTDLLVIVMPLPLIWKLNLPRDRKIGVCGMFALSSIVLVASIARAIYLSYPSSYDFTYEGIPVNIWCIMEPAFGIVGACLPLMVPLFRKVIETTTFYGKTTGTGESSGWGHSRSTESQKGVSQNTSGKGSEESTEIGYTISENDPRTSMRNGLTRTLES